MPKTLEPPGIGYHDSPEMYSIVQPSFLYENSNDDIKEYNNQKFIEHKNELLVFNLENKIELNTLASCIIEVNQKYIAVACPKKNNIKFLDIHNEFKEDFNLPNIFPYEGNNTMCVSEDKKKILIGCKEGISVISIDNLKKIKEIHMNQSILCLDFYNNDCIACISLKGDQTFVKQLKVKNNFKNISKLSEKQIYSKNDMNWIKVINNKIFYLNNTNSINFYQYI